MKYEDPFHIVEFSTEDEPQAEISQNLVDGGWALLTMESVEMSLEDIFLQLTSEEDEIQ